jgi:ABC-type branched-subunit amino acid transport system permease subunit
MSNSIRNGLRAGIIFGIVIIFLFLIGFTLIAPELISKLYQGSEQTKDFNIGLLLPNLVIFMGLLGIWAGITGAKEDEPDTWAKAIVAGLTTGLTTGLLVGITAFIVGTLYQNEVDIRDYLVSLSNENIILFLFNQNALTGALYQFGLMTITSVIGGILAIGVGRASWRKNLAEKIGDSVRQTASMPKVAGTINSKYTRFALLAIIIVISFALPQQWGSYWNYVMGTVGIYVLLGIGLNIIIGWAGQLVLGYVAFFAIGAYTFALLTSPEPHHLEWNFWFAIVLAILAATLSGVLLGLPILSLRGDYLAIVTLGFGEIVRIMIKSDMMTGITNGPRGLRDVGGPTLFGQDFSTDINFMYLIIIAVLLTTFLAYRLQNSRTGRGWIAIREDDTVAQATGVNTFRSKLLSLALGAAIAGLAGALFASRNQFTGPEDHALMVSINVLCIVIVGGMGSIPGMFLGAFVLKGVPEMLREVEIYRLLVFGALLVVMMIIRPEGLWPLQRPRIEKYDEHQKQIPG